MGEGVAGLLLRVRVLFWGVPWMCAGGGGHSAEMTAGFRSCYIAGLSVWIPGHEGGEGGRGGVLYTLKDAISGESPAFLSY